MSEVTNLTVVMVILSLALALSVVGFFISSPVFGIFVVVFGIATMLVLHDLRNVRVGGR